MREPLADRTQGKWPNILPLVGIPSHFLTGKHGPCPLCKGGKDRFRFTNHDDNGGWFCSKCGGSDGIELVKRFYGIEFKEAAERIEAVIGNAVKVAQRPKKSAFEQQQTMKALWESGQPLVPGCFASVYLAGRGLMLERFPSALRTVHDAYWDRTTQSPTMLAKVTGLDGKPVNVHRTFLTVEGKKAPLDPVRKLMEGQLPDGAAVRLGKPRKALGVAEGIETALAASILFQMPVWAALVAQNLAKFIPPPEVEQLIIYADNDESFTGQAAAFTLAKSLRAKGQRVDVAMPDICGQDWNDVLLNRNGSAV